MIPRDEPDKTDEVLRDEIKEVRQHVQEKWLVRLPLLLTQPQIFRFQLTPPMNSISTL